jgi:hypothetical protein
MRPIPQTRHLLALAFFVACATMAQYFALTQDRFSDSQVFAATAALKRHDGTVLANDAVFGTIRWRFHTPFLQSLLEVTLVPSGYADPMLPFRLMTGAMVFIYLAGMYALLYRQCRSWSISAFVAILSSAVVDTIGRGYWGIGPLGSITPAAMIMAISPLIILAYLRYQNQWQVLLVFAFVGLCGNIHLVSAVNLTLVMLVMHLGCRRFRLSSWPTAVACGLSAALAASPYALYYLHLRYVSVPPQWHLSLETAYAALRLADADWLYPEVLKQLFNWMFFVLVLLVPAAAVLSRVERFRVRDLGVWIWLAVGALLVGVVGQGLSQLAGALTDTAPLIDFVQASRFVMLPLYVLFAQALTNLFRIVRSHPHALRWVCAGLLAAWMIPSDNLQPARHMAYRWATSFIPQKQRPLRVQELERKQRREDELNRIADWARVATPLGSVFMIGDVEFRMRSRRAIVASSQDLRYYYYVTPWDVDVWIEQIQRQQIALRPPAGQIDPAPLTALAADVARRREVNPHVPVYAIIQTIDIAEGPTALQIVAPAGWGEFYALLRVR